MDAATIKRERSGRLEGGGEGGREVKRMVETRGWVRHFWKKGGKTWAVPREGLGGRGGGARRKEMTSRKKGCGWGQSLTDEIEETRGELTAKG